MIITNQPFSQVSLHLQIQKLLSFYLDNGFPYVNIEPINFIIDDSTQSISYTLKINEGPLVRINNLQFSKISVSDYRLKRLIRFKPNQIFSKAKIEKYLQKIEQENMTVTDYQLMQYDSTYVLQINLKENLYQTLTGALSYSFNYREFNGFLYLNLNNIFASLRRIYFGWEKTNRFANFSLSYYDPYLYNFDLLANGTHYTYDTLYAKTNFNADFGLPITTLFSFNFNFQYDQTATSLSDLSSFHTLWFGQGFKLYQPASNKQKYNLQLSTALGMRSSLQPSQILSQTSFNFEMHFPLNKNLAFSPALVFKNLYSNHNLAISDSMLIGGTKTLRGFQENEFTTDRYILSRNQLSLYRNKNLDTYLLADLSYFNSQPNNLLKLGYGVGLSIKSKYTNAEISYAIPYPEKPLNGKIHLKLSNNF